MIIPQNVFIFGINNKFDGGPQKIYENFIDEIKHLIRGKENLKEITRKQRDVTRPPLNEIFKRKDKKSKCIFR